MKDQVKKYIDKLFTEVYDTKQLLELKEEISANLMEKINDYIASGESKDTAFQKAVSSLGDMGELVDSLKKASEEKMHEEIFKSQPIGKKHAIGYTVASAILLIGLMLAGFENNLYIRGHRSIDAIFRCICWLFRLFWLDARIST